MKKEVLNHVFCFSLRHLDYINQHYATSHNEFRPHQSLDNCPPGSLDGPLLELGIKTPTHVRGRTWLGAMLSNYYRQAVRIPTNVRCRIILRLLYSCSRLWFCMRVSCLSNQGGFLLTESRLPQARITPFFAFQILCWTMLPGGLQLSPINRRNSPSRFVCDMR